MNIYCLDVSAEYICVIDIEMNSNFEVVAAKLHDFNDNLYGSFDDYLNNVISLQEFLSDIHEDLNIIPTHIYPNKDHINEYKNSDELIVIGPHSNPSYFMNIEMCRHIY